MIHKEANKNKFRFHITWGSGVRAFLEEIQIKETDNKKESIQQLKVQPCILIPIYATRIYELTDTKSPKSYNLVT